MSEPGEHDWEDVGDTGMRMRKSKPIYSELEDSVVYGSWHDRESREATEKIADEMIEKGISEEDTVRLIHNLFHFANQEEKASNEFHGGEEWKLNRAIKSYKNGPAVIDFGFEGANVKTIEEDLSEDFVAGRFVAICRCGKSKEGLLCDGSHKPQPLI